MTADDSHQLLLELVSNLPITTGRLDAQGVLREIYGEGIAKFGFKEARPLGRSFLKHFHAYRRYLCAALEGGHAHFEIKHMGADGKLFYAEACFAFNEGRDEGAIFFLRDITRRRELEISLIDCTDREQIRIGQELHDSLGQELTGLSYLVRSLRNTAEAGTLRSEDILEIQERVRETLEHSRSIARKLCPDVPPSGLVPAFTDMAEHFRKLFGIECVFENRMATPVWDGTVSFNLCRIAQEAVMNAVRHGQASKVTIRMVTGAENCLSVADDGCGKLSPEMLEKSNGMGLAMMQHRAGVIGGRIRIVPRKPQGVVLECTFLNEQSGEPKSPELVVPAAKTAGVCVSCACGA